MLVFLKRLAATFRSRKQDQQTAEEMEFHLDMERQAALRRGLSPEDAAREALLRAGVPAAALEAVRDQRRLTWLDGTMLDLRHAFNSLRHQPSFLFSAGGALAAAVAINTLIFTIVNGVLLSPLPYREPDRLVRVYEFSERNPKFPLSIYNYQENRRHAQLLDGIALYTRVDVQLMHDERPERIPAVAITDSFLPVLGVTPALGRNFTEADLHDGAYTVMLSHTLWKSRFHADPRVIGQQIRLNRKNYTIVGVTPEGFQHVGGNYRSPMQGDTVGIWCPLSMDLPAEGARGWHFTNAIARLKSGVTEAAAEAELNTILQDLGRRFPDNYEHARARTEPLYTAVVGTARRTVIIIAGAGSLVLLLACFNIAGLSVARSLARRRELAIRQALGSGRWRVLRAVLAENLLVGVAGGVIGLLLAGALFPVLHLALPADFPRAHAIAFTWQAALFAFAIALATSVIAGILPALRQVSADPKQDLGEEGRATASGRMKGMRSALVAAEIALSCLLCFCGLLLVRSAQLLGTRDHGFQPGGALTFQLHLPNKAYPEREQVSAFLSRASDELSRIPGVQAAGLMTNVPWTGWDENSGFGIIGRPARPGEAMQARYQAADAGSLKALGMRLISGRWIEPRDRQGAPLVVVINEALAKRYFDRDPVDQQLDLWGKPRRIIGVASAVTDHPADPAAEPAYWFPLAQQPFEGVTAVLRASGDPRALLPAARNAIAGIDRELPLSEVRTLDEIAAEAFAERNFTLWLCEAFAALAMSLAAIGVYGMLTCLVAQRRKEIGLRMALGATRAGVLRMILGTGLGVAAAGVAIGLLLAPCRRYRDFEPALWSGRGRPVDLRDHPDSHPGHRSRRQPDSRLVGGQVRAALGAARAVRLFGAKDPHRIRL